MNLCNLYQEQNCTKRLYRIFIKIPNYICNSSNLRINRTYFEIIGVFGALVCSVYGDLYDLTKGMKTLSKTKEDSDV